MSPVVFCVFQERKLRSNRTPHSPPARFVWYFLLFCPRRVCLFACSGCASLMFWRFLGVLFGPGRFLDSLGTSLRPFSWTRGGKGVLLLSFLWFLFSRSVVFAATHISRLPKSLIVCAGDLSPFEGSSWSAKHDCFAVSVVCRNFVHDAPKDAILPRVYLCIST